MRAREPTTDAQRFVFSGPQWAGIMSAVQAGCVQPEWFSRSLLLIAARRYRARRFSYRPPEAEARLLMQAAAYIRRARKALANTDPSLLNNVLSVHGPLRRDSFFEMLDLIERFATSRVGKPSFHPRRALYQTVLALWSVAGGSLKYSRGAPSSQEPGALCGPTIRYFQAVLNPVMEGDAPTLEGMRKIVDRQAALHKKLRANSDYVAVRREATQKVMGGDAPTPEGTRKIVDRRAAFLEERRANNDDLATRAQAIQIGRDLDGAERAAWEQVSLARRVPPRDALIRMRVRFLLRGLSVVNGTIR